ncbi:MAG: phosphoribosyltransferase [Hyphomicrobiaceae bacterium]
MESGIEATEKAVAEVIDQACSLMAQACHAKAVLVLADSGSRNWTAGAHGMKSPVARSKPKKKARLQSMSEPLTVAANFANDPDIQRDQFAEAIPFAHNTLRIPLNVSDGGGASSIYIFDPSKPIVGLTAASILSTASLVEQLLQMQGRTQERSAKHKASATPTEPQSSIALPLATFLNETLLHARKLKTRGDVSYLALRAWRASLKPYQISALKALKAAPPREFVDLIAGEMLDAVNKLIGDARFDFVVAIPCSRSAPEACLSQKIGQQLAVRLGIPYEPALITERRTGASHPKTSVNLPPMRMDRKLKGRCLLVDDVATSGAHIHQAATLLKEQGVAVISLAWIG